MSEVYFIRPVGMAGPVKIGWSATPVKRLGTLMCWSPFPLEIAVTVEGGLELEANIHQCLADTHSHREWFHESPALTGIIDKLKAGIPIGQAMDLSDRKPGFRKRAQAWHRTEEDKRHRHYSAAVWGLLRKANKGLAWHEQWSLPSDVKLIMMRWRKDAGPGILPTAAEIARLDLFIASPDLILRRIAA